MAVTRTVAARPWRPIPSWPYRLHGASAPVASPPTHTRPYKGGLVAVVLALLLALVVLLLLALLLALLRLARLLARFEGLRALAVALLQGAPDT
eukprot:scaffold116240_cov43-Phaeocystis_antarctica.AAC.1